MRYFIFLLFISLFLIGCESQAERDARITQEAREALLAEQALEEKEKKHLEESTTLGRMGITREDQKIMIDTNRTKHFFENAAAKLTSDIKGITQEIGSEIEKVKDETVKVEGEQVAIDFNKTARILDKWGEKMQGFVHKIGNFSKEIEKTLIKDYNATD